MHSVTEIIRLAGLSGDGFEFVTPHALARGSAVHAAIALAAAGRLDESSVHPEVAPRLASWRRWMQESGFVYERGEFAVTGPGWIGHPDCVGTLRGVRFVVDWKGGAPADWHGVQLAAYAVGTGVYRRAAVYLKDDGSAASWREYLDFADFRAWDAACRKIVGPLAISSAACEYVGVAPTATEKPRVTT